MNNNEIIIQNMTTDFLLDKNILGYLVSAGFSIDMKHICLVRQILFNGRFLPPPRQLHHKTSTLLCKTLSTRELV